MGVDNFSGDSSTQTQFTTLSEMLGADDKVKLATAQEKVAALEAQLLEAQMEAERISAQVWKNYQNHCAVMQAGDSEMHAWINQQLAAAAEVALAEFEKAPQSTAIGSDGDDLTRMPPDKRNCAVLCAAALNQIVMAGIDYRRLMRALSFLSQPTQTDTENALRYYIAIAQEHGYLGAGSHEQWIPTLAHQVMVSAGRAVFSHWSKHAI